MRILVCGGRDFSDRNFIFKTLAKLYLDEWNDLVDSSGENLTVIAGKAKGVDTFAEQWAKCSGFNFLGFPALWKLHLNSAGPIRNQQMIDEGKPDLVVAFPGGKGTANMISKAKKAGIPVREIVYDKA